ncbi:hypothetical protein QR680_006288 [Steinernema hermaphroditum]|uniref:Gustatory receptor n=1 Tax=Steinernema hermaphroditum TaxID=289476 RepID=A0AA39HV09_9BILA|nr:hypothetical protein QR680_006288 [Steinernema hermaphroditum]
MLVKVTDSAHTMEHAKALDKNVIDASDEPCNQLDMKKLLLIAHVFGVHPFKGTSKHNTTNCCEKGSWHCQISVFGTILAGINLLAVINHFQFEILSYLTNISSGIFSDASTESILQIIIFLVTLLTLLLCFSNVNNSHRLLHYVNTLQIHKTSHRHFLMFWKYLVTIIFLVSYVIKIAGQFMLSFVLYDYSDDTTDVRGFNKVLQYIDKIYYNLVEFPICQIPLLYLSIMAMAIGMAFKENSQRFDAVKPMTRHSLHLFHEQLNKLSVIINQFDKNFNKLLLLTVISSLIQIIFRAYLFITNVVKPPKSDQQRIALFLDSLNMLIANFTWTFVVVLGTCVYVNEISRSGIFRISSELVDEDLKHLKDQVYQKLTDYSWGFSIGHFVRIERPLILTMISLIFTIVVIWIQFSMSASQAPTPPTTMIAPFKPF